MGGKERKSMGREGNDADGKERKEKKGNRKD